MPESNQQRAISPAELAAAPFFTTLSDDERATLAKRFERMSCPAATVLFEQGQPRQLLHLVLEGSVDVTEQTYGRTHKLATCGPGTVLGEALLIGDAHHSCSGTTTGPCVAACLDRDGVEALRQQQPTLFATLAVICGRWMARRLANASRGGRGLGAGSTTGATRREHVSVAQ